MAHLRRLAILAAALICLPLLLGAGAASVRADDVPGVGSWAHYRFTTSSDPIHVVFKDAPRVPQLTIPRSYILWASGAPPSTQGPLPEQLRTDELKLSFSDPSGEAWSTRVTAHAAERKINLTTAARELRAVHYIVTLRPNLNPAIAAVMRRNAMHLAQRKENFEGLVQYSMGRPTYFGEASDEFILARCSSERNPGFFCEYNMIITDGIIANAAFVDFRLNGGREYANRRLRLVRKTVCRFISRC